MSLNGIRRPATTAYKNALLDTLVKIDKTDRPS